jgi:hypothetical protein
MATITTHTEAIMFDLTLKIENRLEVSIPTHVTPTAINHPTKVPQAKSKPLNDALQNHISNPNTMHKGKVKGLLLTRF